MSEICIGPNPCYECGGEYGQHDSSCRVLKRKKMEAEEVPLDVCSECHVRLKPRGSRCINCGKP